MLSLPSKAKFTTILLSFLFILLGVTSAYHVTHPAERGYKASPASPVIATDSRVSPVQSEAGDDFSFTFNSYKFSRAAKLQRYQKIGPVLEASRQEEKRKLLKNRAEVQRIVDKANAQKKHTVPFADGAWANSKSRYSSWLNADRTIASLSSPRAYAVVQIDKRGWKMSQWACLDRLWWHESNWGYKAGDSSGKNAYGIPQAAPGKKMAAAGDDWRTNPYTQVDWGLDYIENRFGTPCEAWKFWAYQAAYGDHGWGWY